ncbi:MAG TPA: hypothetical protein PKK69_03330 [Ferruginibacter sp.]|nr:hypothetical protein [Ferruginibacter sp.]
MAIAMISCHFCSCIKEKNTFTEAWFLNATSHQIDVVAYSNGGNNSAVSFSLQPHESKWIDTYNQRGLTPGMSFGLTNYLNDSFVVIFDDQYAITHYKVNLTGNNPKSYGSGSHRNLYNDSSYEQLLENQTKHSRHFRFTYTFRESDFLDAQ